MDNFRRYRVVDSEVKFEGKIVQVFVDHVRFPTGEIHERETIRHKGAVGIVPVTSDGTVILVEQYRHAIEGALVEIPAGKLDAGEDPRECAQRELIEETGYRSSELVKLAEFYTSPGYSNEFFRLFLGRDLREGKKEEGREEERDLKIVKIPLEEALRMVATNKIRDGKTIAGLTLAKRYLDSSRRRKRT